MAKVVLTKAQRELSKLTDSIIASGDVNKILRHFAMLMADGQTPKPRQIAKASAHIFNTQNQNLALNFSIEFGGLGAFVEQLQDIVLDKGTAEDLFDFAQYVHDADKVKLGLALRRKRNKMWYNAFIKRFPHEAMIIAENSRLQERRQVIKTLKKDNERTK